MINVFGSNHGEIGDLKENLILKTAGKIKILIGRKFIDLLDNNGNINSAVSKVITSISSLDQIKLDGLYYYNNDLIASIEGKLMTLTTNSGNTYVSFLEELKATSELQSLALKNIGFLYDNLNEVKSPTKGIIYVESEKSLYIILEGSLTKYYAEIPNPYPKQFVISKENQDSIGALVIQGNGLNNSLHFDLLDIYTESNYSNYVSNNNHIFKIGNNEIVRIDLLGITTDLIKSKNASSDYGYRLYTLSGESTLEVDNLIVRNGLSDLSDSLLPVEYFNEENIITNIEIDDSTDSEFYLCYLKYLNTYEIGDTILFFINDEYDEETELTELIQITSEVIDSEESYIKIESEYDLENHSNLICCLISRNSLLNNDLVIGKIENQYNDKKYGIISKQNIFYSSLFDLDGESSKKTNYPFYSDSLYKGLQSNLNNEELKSVCLPLGLSVYNNFINGSNSILKLINRLENLERRVLSLENFDNGEYIFKQELYTYPFGTGYDKILKISSSYKSTNGEMTSFGPKNFLYSGYIGDDIVDEISITEGDPVTGMFTIGSFFVLIKYKKNESSFKRYLYLIFKQSDSNLELTIEITLN